MEKILQLADYQIVLGNALDNLKAFLAQQSYSQIFILVDENTKQHCLPKLSNENDSIINDANIIEIESGEWNKNLTTCQQIWKHLLAKNADRNALLINLGGGVIGDMGGFVAATYKRGIDFVQIPTTLLAQVDASIGGKLGVDFEHVKNIIGCFNNPKTVLIDPAFLQSLSQRQIRNGFAEVIKHALIADADYWTQIQQISELENVDWTAIIYRSLQIKRAIVTEDPYEKGVRKILNFGHTLGHAIESYSLENDADPLLHGEAIAIGMITELYLSVENKIFSQKTLEQLLPYFSAIYPKYDLTNIPFETILAYLKNDKKNKGQQINFTLLQDIGQAVYNQQVTEEGMMGALEFYQKG